MKIRFALAVLLCLGLVFSPVTFYAQEDHNEEAHQETNHSKADHDHSTHDGHAVDKDDHGSHSSCGHHESSEFDPGKTAIHHISDQNVYNIGPFQIPLPCILYVPGKGFEFFSSGKFDADYHGNGTKAWDGYVLYGGQVRKVTDPSFPKGQVDIGKHSVFSEAVEIDGKEVDQIFLCYQDERIICESKSTLDFWTIWRRID